MRLGLGTDISVGYRQPLFGVVLPLLDTYTGAAAAYSLRLLRTGVTNVVRVREDSGNTEQDFTAKEVTDGTLEAFVGAGNNGYVVTWYDQSGNGNHATQSTAANQPKIVDAGVLVTENGLPALDFDGVDDTLVANNAITNNTHTVVGVFVDKEDTTFKYFYDGGNLAEMMFGTTNTEDRYRYSSGGIGTFSDLVGVFNDPISLLSFAVHGTTSQISINGNLNLSGQSKSNPLAGPFVISNSAAGSLLIAKQTAYEYIVYASDQSSNRTGIEANINDHYSIYP